MARLGILIAFLTLSHLMILGCDSVSGVVGGKSCFLNGEKIEVLIDSNEDEWPVSGETLETIFGPVDACVVSKKAVSIPDQWGIEEYLLTEGGAQIEVSEWDQFIWMVAPLEAEWTKPPEGWEDS